VCMPWDRAGGAYREMLLQTFNPNQLMPTLRLALARLDRGTHPFLGLWTCLSKSLRFQDSYKVREHGRCMSISGRCMSVAAHCPHRITRYTSWAQ
jgi:hypothetical protein